jgi:aspartate/methionine/tyrosine aminotransferase
MLVKKLVIDKANRQHLMPPDILAFARTDKSSNLLRRADLIDLASFRWPVSCGEDQLAAAQALAPATREQIASLKQELAAWLTARFQTRLSPEKEIFIGGGVSALMHQLALAYVDAGEVAFVPSLGLPLYRQAVRLANGEPVGYEISSKSDWLPRFDRLKTRLGRVARLLFVNSPHDPTGAELSEKAMAELAWLAGKENVLIVNDATYAGLAPHQPASILSVSGGTHIGVEVHSFSTLFGLPLLPFGFVVGNRDVINGLKPIARAMTPPVPAFQVDMAMQAIRQSPKPELHRLRSMIDRTRGEAEHVLNQLQLDPVGYAGAPYVWAKISKRTVSVDLARQLYRRHRILVAPGPSFGEHGEGYIRLCLLAGPEAFAQAAERLKKRGLRRKGKS